MQNERNEIFKRIAQYVISELEHFQVGFSVDSPSSTDVFVNLTNPFRDSNRIAEKLLASEREIRDSQLRLINEPFIAYVKAEIDGVERFFLVCRGYTPLRLKPKNSRCVYVNYMAALGKLVELDIGEESEIVIQKKDLEVKVLEKNIFIPQKKQEQWDAINNQISFYNESYTLDSLRRYLDGIDSILTKLGITFEQLLEMEFEELEKAKVERLIAIGFRRSIIDRMSLRDQPILDKIQGCIWRSQLDSRLIITGVPGTGKTTLLIKRLRQKSNLDFLSDEEKDYFSRNPEHKDLIGLNNWKLFTPTSLLREFLKENVSKSGLPAPDSQIKVWDQERLTISRDVLKIIIVDNKDSGFTLSRENLLNIKSNSDHIRISDSFHKYICSHFTARLKLSLEALIDFSANQKLIGLFRAEKSESMSMSQINEIPTFVFRLSEELSGFKSSVKEILSSLVERVLKNIMLSNPNTLDAVSDILIRNKEEKIHQEYSDNIEEFEDEFPLNERLTNHNVKAKQQLERAIINFSELKIKNKKMRESSLISEIITLINPDFFNNSDIEEIGRKVIERREINYWTRGYKLLLDDIPQVYKKFRNSHFEMKREDENKVSTLELDILIMTMLLNARNILKINKENVSKRSKYEILENIKTLYKTVISVDEATDFSSVQLGCMQNLVHPSFDSINIVGDLMQRVTAIGLTDWNECNIFFDKRYQIESVKRVYRQNNKLLKLAEKMYENFLNQSPDFTAGLPAESTEPDPLQFSSHGDDNRLAQWVTSRIVDIFKIHARLPSIAIFVKDDSEINWIVNLLSDLLYGQHSLEIIGCPKGDVLRNEEKIRVFGIEHIKGLEFEAVFFINVDEIEDSMPDLIDKYIYVGMTRAAAFLGITWNNTFPKKIKFLESDFKYGTWEI